MTIDLDDPVALMLAASAACEKAGLEVAAYGGLAAGVYGEPRETRDADLAVTSVLSTRELDLKDARGVIEKRRPRLDERLLREELEALARELPDHAIRVRADEVLR